LITLEIRSGGGAATPGEILVTTGIRWKMSGNPTNNDILGLSLQINMYFWNKFTN
jgi:hypothetical protein